NEDIVRGHPYCPFALELLHGYGETAGSFLVDSDIEPRRLWIHRGVVAQTACRIGIGGRQHVCPNYMQILELRLGTRPAIEDELETVCRTPDGAHRHSAIGFDLDDVVRRGGSRMTPGHAHGQLAGLRAFAEWDHEQDRKPRPPRHQVNYRKRPVA